MPEMREDMVEKSLSGIAFDGKTFSEELDGEKLRGDLARVKAVMMDGKVRTISEIADLANVSLNSVGSRIRDLKKEKFGGYPVQSRRVSKHIWHYWLPQVPKFDDNGQGLMGFHGWAA